jgi:hypothetical protein
MRKYIENENQKAKHATPRENQDLPGKQHDLEQ